MPCVDVVSCGQYCVTCPRSDYMFTYSALESLGYELINRVTGQHQRNVKLVKTLTLY